jgi:hypothetical protein
VPYADPHPGIGPNVSRPMGIRPPFPNGLIFCSAELTNYALHDTTNCGNGR